MTTRFDVTGCHSLSIAVILLLPVAIRCHSLSLVLICYDSLSPVVIRYHSLSPVVTLVVPLVAIHYHLLSFVVI